MKESDEIIAAKYAVGALNTDDLVQFADRKLNECEYSDSYLAIIDAEPKVWDEISNYFKVALNEAGVSIPTQEEGVWILLKYHIGLIASGNVNAAKQFKELLNDIDNLDLHKDITKYVGDNIGIHSMYGWYYEDNVSVEETSKGIFEESKKWLAKYSKYH